MSRFLSGLVSLIFMGCLVIETQFAYKAKPMDGGDVRSIRTREDHLARTTDQDAGTIEVRGARQNNLTGVDVSLPRGKLSVVTGVSGSGKSSLAFQTLYAEGQRRYVESFSTYARQFLERMDRPDVDTIEGLIPAVAIEQRNTIRSARSTLGTLTELTDHLKILFAKRAVPTCHVCGEVVRPDRPAEVVDTLLSEHEGERMVITFPFHMGEEEDAAVATAFLLREGYGRLFQPGPDGRQIQELDPSGALPTGRVDVVADRCAILVDERQRLVESLEAAYRLGDGEGTLFLVDADRNIIERPITTRLEHCGHRFPESTEGMFSFSSPLGACPTCNGFGRVMDIDMDRVIPDASESLAEGAIRPWTYKRRSRERGLLRRICVERGIDMHSPWRALNEEDKQLLLDGDGSQNWRSGWPGVRGWFKMLERKKYKMQVRVLLARYRAYLRCDDCGGDRFRPESLRYRLEGETIAQVLSKTVWDARKWVDALPEGSDDEALSPVLDQLRHRLGFLDRVGLGYLTLNRQGRTLSGGEVQRVNLTSAVGSGLVNTLFVLDEPTIGLHARDTDRLLQLLLDLTVRDNTVLLVEHDPDVLAFADHVIDLGPGPGAAGGSVVFQGRPGQMARSRRSVTAKAIAARQEPRSASDLACGDEPGVKVRGARAQNLTGVDLNLPYGRLTLLTGVSGSGKSTLMEEVLYRAARRQKGLVTDRPGTHDAVQGLEKIEEIIWIDQGGPGATPRANPATYVKAWDGIRQAFARQPLSRARGYTPGTFSFNTGKGRCPVCEGAGYELVEMQFLSDVQLVCQLCEGARFVPEVLEVQWKDRSVADLLRMTVDEALEILEDKTAPARRLQVLHDVGLGYLALGQPLSTLSGGEAQRLKIAHHLGTLKTSRGLFLLDEPTSGLHLDDVDRLIGNLRALVDAGNTVLVVEHHLDVIAAADQVVELGPEGGEGGGEVIFQGSPAALAKENTPTGVHLNRWLQGIAPLKSTRRKIMGQKKTRPRSEAGRPAVFDRIEIEGARVHNLKDVSVTLPRRGRTVVSGLSGSGKSSLAFDLLFAEGQRRFLDCLSSYARQYINQLGRPDADRIAGIPPTVAIEQRTTRGGSRSLVANVTEIEPFLRLLYARLGQGSAIPVMSAVELAHWIKEEHGAARVGVLAPMVQSRKGYHKPVFARAMVLGVDEVYVDGKLRPPSPRPRLRRHKLHSVDFVMGWRSADEEPLLAETIARAARLAERQVRLLVDGRIHGPWEITDPNTTPLKRRQLDPRLFSPRTDVGACPQCAGAGHLKDEPETPCSGCDGERLGAAGRQVRFGGRRLPELLALTPPELRTFVGKEVKLTARERQVAAGPLVAIAERCAFLEEVGLAYLGLDRPVRSLSGGEAQRIRLAAQLGAQLSGVLYVLDEPTIGLHPTDTERLLDALDKLQARDNGVVMVEHDAQTLRTADVLVDMGPGAGIEGGEVLVQGPLSEALADERSITGRCLVQGPPRIREMCRELDQVPFITLKGVRHHNLAGVDVRIPRERLTVVSGVSGSGKSSLIHDVLPAAVRGDGDSMVGSVTGLEGLKRVVRVDDKPIGKNPRSTPATYVGIWDDIRKLFAKVPEARLRGYTPGRFSFNVAAGRCGVCNGMGQLTLEMSFLPNARTPCEVCKGKRYSSQTLHVTWDGLSIAQVLDLSVRQALDVFERVPKIKRGLALLADVGLGYLKLGQSSTTLSGGEAQRIKLVSHLMARTRRDTVVVLDEPSIGLHMADVPRLMTVIHRLVDLGATVVVIEHNTDVIREADWVIDLGPGGGPDGGSVVYQGPFEGLSGATGSRTGAWLSRS